MNSGPLGGLSPLSIIHLFSEISDILSTINFFNKYSMNLWLHYNLLFNLSQLQIHGQLLVSPSQGLGFQVCLTICSLTKDAFMFYMNYYRKSSPNLLFLALDIVSSLSLISVKAESRHEKSQHDFNLRWTLSGSLSLLVIVEKSAVSEDIKIIKLRLLSPKAVRKQICVFFQPITLWSFFLFSCTIKGSNNFYSGVSIFSPYIL